MKTVYLKTSGEGFSSEGIGALVQYQLYCYALSKILDCGYVFEGFKNLQHYQYYNITQGKFDRDINEFFNFSKKVIEGDVIPHENYESLQEFIRNKNDLLPVIADIKLNMLGQILHDSSLVEKMENGNLFAPLKSRLFLNKHRSYLNKEKTFVAIHVRKFTKTDCDTAEVREYFGDNKHQYYLNIMGRVRELIPNSGFHIYSQGDSKDLDFLKQDDVHFHIEEYPVVSIYHMVHSDILVMANSSMSYIAHLLGNPITFVRDNFYHPTYSKRRIDVSSEGSFNEDILKRIIGLSSNG